MGIWDVKPDGERECWSFTALVGVGPLRFGMTPQDVAAALGTTPGMSGQGAGHFTGIGVTTYDRHERLEGVAVDALRGPQVTLDGTALVAQVPSVMEDWILDHIGTRGLDLCYTHAGDPGSADLGLILRAQRAGDVVLTRPLFLVREWVMNSWDCVPGQEWKTF